MPRLLAPENASFALERFEDVAIADGRRHNADALLAHELVESEIRHLGHGHEVDPEMRCDNREDPVAVHLVSGRVHREHAVAVPVECDAQMDVVGPHGLAEQERSVAPQPTLMFVPSGGCLQ